MLDHNQKQNSFDPEVDLLVSETLMAELELAIDDKVDRRWCYLGLYLGTLRLGGSIVLSLLELRHCDKIWNERTSIDYDGVLSVSVSR